jgi:FkbM family methyltransferase
VVSLLFFSVYNYALPSQIQARLTQLETQLHWLASETTPCKTAPCKRTRIRCNRKPRNIFLDVGSNKGDVITAFYNNGKHAPKSNNPKWRFPIRPYSPKDWHVIGIEASPTHYARLSMLQNRYPKLEIIQGAVWDDTKDTVMLSIDDDPHFGGRAENGEWGTSVVRDWSKKNGSSRMAEVQTIDMPTLVLNRTCPQDRIVMKMNVEGAEFQVMKAMYWRGLFCRFDVVDMYWHPSFLSDDGTKYGQIAIYEEEFKRCGTRMATWSVH